MMQILQSIEDGVLVIDREHRVLYANPAICGGSPSPEFTTEDVHCHELRHTPPDPCADCSRCVADRVFADGEPIHALRVCPCADNCQCYYEVSASPIYGRSKELVGVLQIIRDVTEQYQMGTRLEDAEALATLGRIAAGIVHDLNSSIAVIATCVEGLLRASSDPATKDLRQLPYFTEYLETMQRAAYLSKATIEDTLRLAVHQEEPNWQWIDIHDVLRESLALVKYEAAESHKRIQTDWADGLEPIRADPLQLARVFLNLIHNALDAVAEKDGYVKVATRAIPEGVQVVVFDTGDGILPEHQARIFDPFFTTKPTGRGMGIGLTLSRSILEYHKGELLIDSEPNIGTTAWVKLVRDPRPATV